MKIRQKTYFETTYIFCCLISVQPGDALFGCRDVIRKALSCKLPLFQKTTLNLYHAWISTQSRGYLYQIQYPLI